MGCYDLGGRTGSPVQRSYEGLTLKRGGRLLGEYMVDVDINFRQSGI
jgi:hypothetical protein